MYDCFPDLFVDPELCMSVDPEYRRIIYSCIFTLAVRLKRSEANLKTAQAFKVGATELSDVLKELRVIDLDTVDDARSIYYQVHKTCHAILKIFKYCNHKLGTNVVEYFVKYCQKKRNFFYEVASPLFDREFCAQFNTASRAAKKNPERQEYLAISRIANGLSWEQTTQVNKQV